YVQASPYFAVTNSNGSFTIAGLPPGNYVVEAVHPVLGTKTAKVKIGAGAKAKAKASFTFAAK
nr:carboxypeptidase-like regulatory domain-containing protein [Kofleriaceae bacterium]